MVTSDRAELILGHAQSFTYGGYSPEGVDLVAQREVVEVVAYPDLSLGK